MVCEIYTKTIYKTNPLVCYYKTSSKRKKLHSFGNAMQVKSSRTHTQDVLGNTICTKRALKLLRNAYFSKYKTLLYLSFKKFRFLVFNRCSDFLTNGLLFTEISRY